MKKNIIRSKELLLVALTFVLLAGVALGGFIVFNRGKNLETDTALTSVMNEEKSCIIFIVTDEYRLWHSDLRFLSNNLGLDWYNFNVSTFEKKFFSKQKENASNVLEDNMIHYLQDRLKGSNYKSISILTIESYYNIALSLAKGNETIKKIGVIQPVFQGKEPLHIAREFFANSPLQMRIYDTRGVDSILLYENISGEDARLNYLTSSNSLLKPNIYSDPQGKVSLEQWNMGQKGKSDPKLMFTPFWQKEILSFIEDNPLSMGKISVQVWILHSFKTLHLGLFLVGLFFFVRGIKNPKKLKL